MTAPEPARPRIRAARMRRSPNDLAPRSVRSRLQNRPPRCRDEPNQQLVQHGVRAQELFDTALFRLPWNGTLAGSRSTTVEGVAALRPTPIDKDRGWYEDVPAVPWPLDVLACRVRNLMWARRNHRAYASILRILVVVVAATVLDLGWVRGLFVDELMVKLFVPLMPALLDLVEIPRQHDAAAATQEEAEATI